MFTTATTARFYSLILFKLGTICTICERSILHKQADPVSLGLRRRLSLSHVFKTQTICVGIPPTLTGRSRVYSGASTAETSVRSSIFPTK